MVPLFWGNGACKFQNALSVRCEIPEIQVDAKTAFQRAHEPLHLLKDGQVLLDFQVLPKLPAHQGCGVHFESKCIHFCSNQTQQQPGYFCKRELSTQLGLLPNL